MRRIKRTMSRQQETLAVTALAFAVVFLYALWGASVLNQERELGSASNAQVVVNR